MALQRGRGKDQEKASGLIITSLIDYFSIVVIYLMKSYSAEGSIMTNADNLILPNSMANTKPKEINIQVAANNDMIMVDNIPLIPTEDVRKITNENPNPIIPKVVDKLIAAYKAEEEMVRLGAINQVAGDITIQCDKNLDFDVVFKIMNTCGSVGYNKMNFAVMEREQ